MHPFSRWSFQRVQEFVPVAAITSPHPTTGQPESAKLLKELSLEVPGGRRVTAIEHFQRSHADSFLVMRDWEVIDEWYGDVVDPTLPHIIFSISKSLTGMLAGVAAGEGLLDPEATVSRYMPETKGSAYDEARVRDLLDMTVSVDFDEEYLDADGAFDRYRRAMLWNPERPGAQPENLGAFLCSLKPGVRAHGERFYYASPNTDMLGLVIERATGVRYVDYLADKLWRPMGATGQAFVTVDRIGTARAAGGISVTIRDLARLGQLVLDQGRAQSGQQVIPADWIADMHQNGDRKAWQNGNFSHMFPSGRYRSCWYDVGDGRGSFAAVGIHGQWLWVDPASRIVLAKFSSRPGPSDDAATALEIEMLGQIARAV
jgi:CubicO group peptidase (beta-lactamase class C family)